MVIYGIVFLFYFSSLFFIFARLCPSLCACVHLCVCIFVSLCYCRCVCVCHIERQSNGKRYRESSIRKAENRYLIAKNFTYYECGYNLYLLNCCFPDMKLLILFLFFFFLLIFFVQHFQREKSLIARLKQKKGHICIFLASHPSH